MRRKIFVVPEKVFDDGKALVTYVIYVKEENKLILKGYVDDMAKIDKWVLSGVMPELLQF